MLPHCLSISNESFFLLIFLSINFPSINRQLHKVRCADDPQDSAHNWRELFAARIVYHDGVGKVVAGAAGFKLSTAGSKYIFHPFRFARVGECNQESATCFENVDWRAIDPARPPSPVGKNAETGYSSGKTAGDAVRDRQIESRDPALAEADEHNGCRD